MKTRRLNARTILLILVEAMLLFGGLIVAVYLRLEAPDAERELIEKHGFYKAALATIFCLSAFYLYDLYDFVVMHDRRELVLRICARRVAHETLFRRELLIEEERVAPVEARVGVGHT